MKPLAIQKMCPTLGYMAVYAKYVYIYTNGNSTKSDLPQNLKHRCRPVFLPVPVVCLIAQAPV